MKKVSRIKELLKLLSKGVYEKEHIIAMALLSAIAGESIFLLGPPGTAKSLVARRLKLAFMDGRAFEYLMSHFSTPDEIFGPVSISLLKNEDRYERVVEGFMPTATIVFLDEIWKASPSIQNSLLTAINERIFQNGRETIQLPMKALIAASNELPAEDEGLEALWDRFLVRMISNCIQSEETFYKMVRQHSFESINIEDSYLITEEEYHTWQKEIEKIGVPDEICEAVTFIRMCFKEESKKEEVNDMDYYVSDRRWKKCFHLMQTSAFLNGRSTIDMTDILILIHCLWNKVESIPIVIDVVCRSLTFSIDGILEKFEKDIDAALKASPSKVREEEKGQKTLNEYLTSHTFYYTICNYLKRKLLFYKLDHEYLDDDKTYDGIIYRDVDKRAWVIRAIYSGLPFEYKTKNLTSVTKVKLRKFNGGVIIDGTPYEFEKKKYPSKMGGSSFVNKAIKEPNIADTIITNIDNDVLPQFLNLQKMFTKCQNLFLSDSDIKLAGEYLNQCEINIKVVYVKAQNTSKLL